MRTNKDEKEMPDKISALTQDIRNPKVVVDGEVVPIENTQQNFLPYILC